MVLVEISVKLIFLFSLQRKESSVLLLVVQLHLWPQWFSYELSLLQVFARRHVFLVSIYRVIPILFSVNYK